MVKTCTFVVSTARNASIKIIITIILMRFWPDLKPPDSMALSFAFRPCLSQALTFFPSAFDLASFIVPSESVRSLGTAVLDYPISRLSLPRHIYSLYPSTFHLFFFSSPIIHPSISHSLSRSIDTHSSYSPQLSFNHSSSCVPHPSSAWLLLPLPSLLPPRGKPQTSMLISCSLLSL